MVCAALTCTLPFSAKAHAEGLLYYVRGVVTRRATEARRATRLVSVMPRPDNHWGEAESTCSPFEAVVVPIEGGRGLVPKMIFPLEWAAVQAALGAAGGWEPVDENHLLQHMVRLTGRHHPDHQGECAWSQKAALDWLFRMGMTSARGEAVTAGGSSLCDTRCRTSSTWCMAKGCPGS